MPQTPKTLQEFLQIRTVLDRQIKELKQELRSTTKNFLNSTTITGSNGASLTLADKKLAIATAQIISSEEITEISGAFNDDVKPSYFDNVNSEIFEKEYEFDSANLTVSEKKENEALYFAYDSDTMTISVDGVIQKEEPKTGNLYPVYKEPNNLASATTEIKVSVDKTTTGATFYVNYSPGELQTAQLDTGGYQELTVS